MKDQARIHLFKKERLALKFELEMANLVQPQAKCQAYDERALRPPGPFEEDP